MCGFLRLFRIHLFLIMTQFQQNLYSIFWEKFEKHPKMTLFGTFWMIQKRFWHAVFCKCSEIILFTFWPGFRQIGQAIFEKLPKNCHFQYIFALYGWSRFFLKNRASSLFCLYQCLTSCKKSDKSLARFSGKTGNGKITETEPLIPSLTSTDVEN